jgi:hypothetical protein
MCELTKHIALRLCNCEQVSDSQQRSLVIDDNIQTITSIPMVESSETNTGAAPTETTATDESPVTSNGAVVQEPINAINSDAAINTTTALTDVAVINISQDSAVPVLSSAATAVPLAVTAAAATDTVTTTTTAVSATNDVQTAVNVTTSIANEHVSATAVSDEASATVSGAPELATTATAAQVAAAAVTPAIAAAVTVPAAAAVAAASTYVIDGQSLTLQHNAENAQAIEALLALVARLQMNTVNTATTATATGTTNAVASATAVASVPMATVLPIQSAAAMDTQAHQLCTQKTLPLLLLMIMIHS